MYPSFFAGFVHVVGLLVTGCVLYTPFLRNLWIQLGLFPKPGEGPSEAFMDQGFLKVTAIAKGRDNHAAKVTFYFPTDPGYRDTVRSSDNVLIRSEMTNVMC